MGDHGKLYSGFDETYAEAMKQLCFRADIMMPNLTEAAMMTGMPWKENWSEGDIRELLNALGGKNVVLTGVGFRPEQTGAAVRFEGETSFYHHERLPKNYHGTGDMFAACFTGALMQGKDMLQAVEIASEFTCRSIRATYENPAHWYGVKFETVLPWLADILQ
jgi:pyridoxine kinase